MKEGQGEWGRKGERGGGPVLPSNSSSTPSAKTASKEVIRAGNHSSDRIYHSIESARSRRINSSYVATWIGVVSLFLFLSPSPSLYLFVLSSFPEARMQGWNIDKKKRIIFPSLLLFFQNGSKGESDRWVEGYHHLHHHHWKCRAEEEEEEEEGNNENEEEGKERLFNGCSSSPTAGEEEEEGA